MLFNTLQFALFFAAVLLVTRALPRGRRGGFLLGASLLFYAFWIPAYLLLLLLDVAVNYALLAAMVRSARPRLFLGVSIVFTLSLLAWFKYAAFLVGSALPLLSVGLGIELPLPEIFLPLGISFYSFQIIALSVDVYRGQTPSVPSLRRYALFVAFFPQLIAGPILRGREFLPQLAQGGVPDPARSRRGVWLLASGLVKKIVLADFLLAPFVEEVFAAPGVASAPFHWVALVSFAFQLYFDFSGYTDVARGAALLLGFELPMNFREPFLARNPAEFWRRWHMTLTSWLRDYVFIPVSRRIMRRAGPRFDGVALDAAQLTTMLLCGLWHGAGWTYVAWGGACGALLVGHRRLARRRTSDEAPVTWRDAPRVAAHFTAFCLTLVLFRSPTFGEALAFGRGLLGGSDLGGWPALQTAVVAACVGLHGAERALRLRLPEIQAAVGGPFRTALEATALGALAGLVFAAAGAGGAFIYFQF